MLSIFNVLIFHPFIFSELSIEIFYIPFFTWFIFLLLSFEKRKKVKLLSCVRLFATPWTVAYPGSLSMGFFRHECWSRLPFPYPGDLPNPGIEPGSPAL